MTGAYNNFFRMFDRNTKRDVTLEASRESSKPRAVLKPRRVCVGGKRRRDDISVDSLDFTKKILHTAWHPAENIIAIAATNNLYIFQDKCILLGEAGADGSYFPATPHWSQIRAPETDDEAQRSWLGVLLVINGAIRPVSELVISHLVFGCDIQMEGLERNASLSCEVGQGRLGDNKGPRRTEMQDGRWRRPSGGSSLCSVASGVSPSPGLHFFLGWHLPLFDPMH
ncbi:hypothetical protein P7K49_006084 [Saguinus oedipus]|uniref:Uncharacterized protein n=1 Tax=Saguinus oedipus TaxID=9490 RepID=A0ABQ9W1D4_SAGOE|nr:hypothetical protein P7K49_006084 [Saguinus oedipus]